MRYTTNVITSANNERIKQVCALQSRRRARHKARAFVIEGLRLAQEVVRARASVAEVFYTGAFAEAPEGAAVISELTTLGAVAIAVTPQVMATMSDTQTPQGLLAVVPFLERELPERLTNLLIVDRVTNPGNLGAVLRTAAAAGVEAIALAPGTVDPTNPKVVRGAMGAHFRVPILPRSWEGIAHLAEDMLVLLADVGGGSPYHDLDWTQNITLILGGEPHGPSEEAIRLTHVRVTIPMQREVESLNVAVAAGVLLFEMARQRN